MPQAIRILRAPYMSLTTHVVKSTTLVSAVGVQQLLFRADHAVAARGHPIEVYFIAAIFYIAINSAILVAGVSGRTTRCDKARRPRTRWTSGVFFVQVLVLLEAALYIIALTVLTLLLSVAIGLPVAVLLNAAARWRSRWGRTRGST